MLFSNIFYGLDKLEAKGRLSERRPSAKCESILRAPCSSLEDKESDESSGLSFSYGIKPRTLSVPEIPPKAPRQRSPRNSQSGESPCISPFASLPLVSMTQSPVMVLPPIRTSSESYHELPHSLPSCFPARLPPIEPIQEGRKGKGRGKGKSRRLAHNTGSLQTPSLLDHYQSNSTDCVFSESSGKTSASFDNSIEGKIADSIAIRGVCNGEEFDKSAMSDKILVGANETVAKRSIESAGIRENAKNALKINFRLSRFRSPKESGRGTMCAAGQTINSELHGRSTDGGSETSQSNESKNNSLPRSLNSQHNVYNIASGSRKNSATINTNECSNLGFTSDEEEYVRAQLVMVKRGRRHATCEELEKAIVPNGISLFDLWKMLLAVNTWSEG